MVDKFHEDHYDPDAEEEDEGGAPPAADGDELEAQDKIIDEEVPENKRIRARSRPSRSGSPQSR